MAAILFGNLQFNTSDGLKPLSGGSIISYAVGTTTPLATALDASGTPAPNPIPLDSGGRPNDGGGLWLTLGSNYDLVVKSGPNGTGTTVMTLSSVNGLSNTAAGIGGSYITSSVETTLPGSSVLTSSGSVIVNTEAGITTLTVSSGFSQKTADYIAVKGDSGSAIVFTGTGPYQLFFDLADNLGSGWFINVINNSEGTVTLDPSGAQLINGQSTYVLQPGSGGAVVCSGAGFYTPIINFEQISPMTTDGDMIYQNNGVGTRLPIGSTNKFIRVEGGLPVYNTGPNDVQNGGLGVSTLDPYEILAAGTSNTGPIQTINLGTSGQALVSNGPGVLPSMQNIAQENFVFLGELNAANDWSNQTILDPTNYNAWCLIIKGWIWAQTGSNSLMLGLQFYKSGDVAPPGWIDNGSMTGIMHGFRGDSPTPEVYTMLSGSGGNRLNPYGIPLATPGVTTANPTVVSGGQIVITDDAYNTDHETSSLSVSGTVTNHTQGKGFYTISGDVNITSNNGLLTGIRLASYSRSFGGGTTYQTPLKSDPGSYYQGAIQVWGIKNS